MDERELTPNEKLSRRRQRLMKFRAVVRLVIANFYWIGELEDTQIGENVRRNIRLLTRKKAVKTCLSLKEKGILNKPKEERTDEEKKHLSKVLSGMKCFRKYPPHVKSQLAAVTYFLYFGPGREIVRQDQEASAMYFILSGECGVTVKHYEKTLGEWIIEEGSVLRPGTMFGEVALLHGIHRLATITTLTDCELLMITKEDFDVVLKSTVLHAWNETQKIISNLSYFDSWDDYTKRECSILSRVKNYNPDDTVLGDGVGAQDYVYFIVSGTAYILETLNVKVTLLQGITRYSLIEDKIDTVDKESDHNYFEKSLIKYNIKGDDEGSLVDLSALQSSRTEKTTITDMSHASDTTIIPDPETVMTVTELSTIPDPVDIKSTKSLLKKNVTALASFYIPITHKETHFMKICELHPGSCFNVGENFIRRRILALTPLTCIIVPRTWIFKNNTGNIFNRVQLYLNKTIPTTQQVFKRFVEILKFKKYRKQLVNEILTTHKMVETNNSIHNVPYSIRLKHGTDTKYFEYST